MVSGIIFDFDGVIADSTPVGIAKTVSVIQKLNLKFGPNPDDLPEAIRKLWGLPYLDIFKALGEKYNWTGLQVQQAQQNAMRMEMEIQPVPGMVECLTALAKKLPTAVISNREQSTGEVLFSQLGLKDVPFDKVQFQEGCRYFKPDHRCLVPAINLLAKKNAGITVDKPVLMLGDTVDYDLKPTQTWQELIIFVGVVSGISTAEEFIKAGVPEHRIIKGIHNIPTRLAEITNW